MFKKNNKKSPIKNSTQDNKLSITFMSNSKTTKTIDLSNKDVNLFNEPLDKLIDGDLPWGWLAHNRDFTEKINNEYSYFLHKWIDARNSNSSPRDLYSALKSFVKYMEDVKRLCKEKGECFELWFNEILTGKEYLNKRKSELRELEKNLATLQNAFEYKQKLLINLESTVIQKLKENDGILQSEFWKLFDASIKNEVSDIVFRLSNENKLVRTKTGRSYTLHYTGR